MNLDETSPVDLWRGNRIDAHWASTVGGIARAFIAWRDARPERRDLLARRALAIFVGDAEGLDSVMDDQAPAVLDAVLDVVRLMEPGPGDSLPRSLPERH